jgi:hypothetical protein
MYVCSLFNNIEFRANPLLYTIVQCISASLHLCISVSLYLCISVSLYLCISVSLYLCISVSLYLCISVSLYLCICICIYICISVWLSDLLPFIFHIHHLFSFNYSIVQPPSAILFQITSLGNRFVRN